MVGMSCVQYSSPSSSPPKNKQNTVFKKDVIMAWHNLVSAQTGNVCITCYATLSAIACMCQAICDVSSTPWVIANMQNQ